MSEPKVNSFPFFLEALREALKQDQATWDWTSLSLPRKPVKAKIIAKSKGVFCGEVISKCIPRLSQEIFGQAVEAQVFVNDGQTFEKGKTLIELHGESQTVLSIERSLLNTLTFTCGVATTTFDCVNRLEGLSTKPRICHTRKFLPGLRDLSVYGILVGGGHPHRLHLGSAVLIKENHIQILGGIRQALESTRSTAPHSMAIELEVSDFRQIAEVLEVNPRYQPQVLLFDNFTPAEVTQGCQFLESQGQRQRFWIEASGGIQLDSVEAYAKAGPDVLSVGALTLRPSLVDLSMLLQ